MAVGDFAGQPNSAGEVLAVDPASLDAIPADINNTLVYFFWFSLVLALTVPPFSFPFSFRTAATLRRTSTSTRRRSCQA
jgi:hypothetical protein